EPGDADVDALREGARVPAVAEDQRRLTGRRALEEDRDDTSLQAGVLARPVHVCEPQRDVRARVDAVPAGEILLAALLGDPIRRERQKREVLGDRAGALA